MRKRHKRIRNGVVVLTIVAVVGLLGYMHKVNTLVDEMEYKISVEQVGLEEKKAELAQVQEELDSMDSLEYVKKVAEDELKMVEKDTIVFKIKE